MHDTSMENTAVMPTPPAHCVCPFCGLLCDDIPGGSGVAPQQWAIRLQGLCPRAAAGLNEASAGSPTPRIDGREVTLEEALDEAAVRLRQSRAPVVGALAADVQAQRSALAVADHLNARIVHRNQFVAQRNLFPYQGRGGITTTLAEIRHRAQIVVLFGGDPTVLFPRILDRIFPADPAFIPSGGRELVLLHADSPPAEVLARLPKGVTVTTVDSGGLDPFDTIAALRALARDPAHPALAGLPSGLKDLAARAQATAYGSVLWCAPQLPGQHADVLVEALHQWMVTLNGKTRWAALPLAGTLGEMGANATASWQTGFYLPVQFGKVGPAYDPFPDYADADALLWLASLPGAGAPQLPGAATDLPCVYVGSPPADLALPARHVVLPTSVPGVSASGHFIRTDSVIALYAQAQQPGALPSAATVLDRLAGKLGRGGNA